MFFFVTVVCNNIGLCKVLYAISEYGICMDNLRVLVLGCDFRKGSSVVCDVLSIGSGLAHTSI